MNDNNRYWMELIGIAEDQLKQALTQAGREGRAGNMDDYRKKIVRDTIFEAIENLNRAAQAVAQIPAPKGGAK